MLHLPNEQTTNQQGDAGERDQKGDVVTTVELQSLLLQAVRKSIALNVSKNHGFVLFVGTLRAPVKRRSQ